MTSADTPRHQLTTFFSAAALATVSAFLAWGSFALLTAMLNPGLEGAEYWSAVRDRARANPTIAAIVMLALIGLIASVAWMAIAFLVRDRRGDERH